MSKNVSLGGWITTLLLVMAGGSIWALFGLMNDGVGALMAIPMALLIRFAMMFSGPFARTCGAGHAAWLYVLCTIYAQYLMIAAELSHTMGVKLIASLSLTGMGMAWDTARLRLDSMDCVLLVVGFLLCVTLGALAPKREFTSTTIPESSI